MITNKILKKGKRSLTVTRIQEWDVYVYCVGAAHYSTYFAERTLN